MPRSRDPNLDLLRAIAILMVLAFHIVPMWPTKYPALKAATHLGKYGVILFFVLSGWLIGGIYWREYAKEGRVRLGNFWMRRWMRTAPPYFAGVLLGYGAVRLARYEPFDFRYLFFLQNYETDMPFYRISWSLCVEEHFYLVLPFVGFALTKLNRTWAAIALWTLPLLPPLLRVIDPNAGLETPFGYGHAATHLIAEGLILGVAASFTARFFPQTWASIQKAASYLFVPALLVFASLTWWDEHSIYYAGQSVVAFCCLVWLAALAGRRAVPYSANSVVYAIAITSYSVYLTHSLAIHFARRYFVPKGSLGSELLCLVLWLTLIAASGILFYFCIERTAIALRERVTRQTKDPQGTSS
ncbi:O-acetyltransferase OatA [Rubripirellula amarantea]|uniref:O-acetyltransferase OatA n=1 Tax=Rubripirellula amarantea TaxID=2527999 RepID=A0A5C5WQD7_9BACT|nr:acyltransferase [Rubripirellula amarantea]TWT52660.1 O-acetyltransferase OatA [Rubripirellula amarantea]